MNTPLISIIIPIYNTGASCLKLIKELRKSTYKNIEIICIDDGSKDDSFEVINNYASGKNNIIIKKQRNAGASSARNAGIKLASGKWISFIDSDDMVDRTFIETLVSAYEDNKTIIANTALLYNRLATNTQHSDFMKRIRQRKRRESIKEYTTYSMLIDGRMYGVINKLFRRDIIIDNNIRFDASLDFAEDTKFVLDYINSAIDYYQIDAEIKSIYEPLYIYNFGTETSTVVKSSLNWNNWRKSYNNLKIWSKDSDTFRLKIRRHLIWCRWRISHALAVARSKMTYTEKHKYLNLIELTVATLLVRARK